MFWNEVKNIDSEGLIVLPEVNKVLNCNKTKYRIAFAVSHGDVYSLLARNVIHGDRKSVV